VVATPLATIHAQESSSRFEFGRGDHVVFVGDAFADRMRLFGYVEEAIVARYPRHQLTFRNLGWSGDTLTLQPRPLNFGTLDDHLAVQKADVVIACFGMSESFDPLDRLADHEREWHAFVEHTLAHTYNGASPPRLVLISPIAHERVAGDLPDPAEHNRRLAAYVEMLRRVANEHRLTLVDLYSPTLSLMNDSAGERLTINGIHLNEYGYWAVGQWIADALSPPGARWRVEIDAASRQATVAGTQVAELQASNKSVRFHATDVAIPVAAAPAGANVHPALVGDQPTLVVRNLRPGNYTLAIDGETVATADATDWAAGVVVGTAPGARKAEQLRAAIDAKNRQFFYRWRAANSEYIFGRRAKPFGVVSFPPELRELDRIVLEKDQQIWSMAEPASSQDWQLVPAAN